jgi:hypothetical protein
MCDRQTLALLTALALFPAAAPGVALAQDPAASAAVPDALRRELDELRKELDGLRQDTSRSFQAAQKSVDALAEQVARLRKEVDDLRRRPPPLTRVARLAPAPATAPSGAIRLINTYAEPVRIVVNGVAYRLDPGEARLLRGQPAGRFTYEISGVREAVERVLAANEMFTIHVHPQ